MRHRYDTTGIVLTRSPLGEANALVTVLAPELGLLRARAQGLRRAGAKLAPGLATFAQSSLILVRGKEGWRIAGAVLDEQWFPRLTRDARIRAARVSGLLTRFAPADAGDDRLFSMFRGFLEALADTHEEAYECAEILAALRILAALGFDAGDVPGGMDDFSPDILAGIGADRAAYIARVNRGIAASEL